MVSPWSVNISPAKEEKIQKKFLDNGENTVSEDGQSIMVKMDKKFVNILLDVLPPIRNHIDRHFNMNDPEDIETVADMEQFYKELIEIKKEFQKKKE